MDKAKLFKKYGRRFVTVDIYENTIYLDFYEIKNDKIIKKPILLFLSESNLIIIRDSEKIESSNNIKLYSDVISLAGDAEASCMLRTLNKEIESIANHKIISPNNKIVEIAKKLMKVL